MEARMLVRPRVLVIDDSALVLEVTRSALESAGFDVDIALDVSAFEEKRRSIAPDVIVVDVQMPEAFGDDLASTLRGAYGVQVPILLLSTLPDQELATRAQAAEATGYVSKRDGLGSLVARIQQVLGEQRSG
jgi:DNA-binding response OmpR family regulator